jgi:SAM-dependent methyltransferase
MDVQRLVTKYKKLALAMAGHPSAPVGDSDRFYSEFEAKFRGSEEEIAKRLSGRYGKLLESHAKKTHRAIDLGCGRGEFLDLSRTKGFSTTGIDISERFVDRCRSKGHSTELGDALMQLKKIPSESADLVISMHVVEHCPFEYNLRVFKEAHRVLVAGGKLIVETPSLYSLWSGHRQFYLDPTHDKPVHPELLKFMCENSGFRQVELREFDPVDCPERPQLAKKSGPEIKSEFEKLERWLYGPMDLAVIATK